MPPGTLYIRKEVSMLKVIPRNNYYLMWRQLLPKTVLSTLEHSSIVNFHKIVL